MPIKFEHKHLMLLTYSNRTVNSFGSSYTDECTLVIFSIKWWLAHTNYISSYTCTVQYTHMVTTEQI